MNSEKIAENYFDNIKSGLIFKKIFDNIKKVIKLNISKYNKSLQKKLNFEFKDFKDFSELYSTIDIELKLVDNGKGKFINFINRKNEYYHIYFDNSKEEIKRNYLKDNEKIKNIKIQIDYQVESFIGLFDDCKCISSITFKKFHRININDMSCMFNGCTSLTEINFSNFNTENVKYMDDMFNGCTSLKELNLSNFDTRNVTNMSRMFYKCSALKELNLSSFNTNNVIGMSYMFSLCLSLKELNLSKFRFTNVTDRTGMFSLTSPAIKIIHPKID